MKVKVIVKANAKHEKIEKIFETEFRIAVKAPPIEGKANQAVIEALARFYDLPKSAVSLLHGEKGKVKWFHIRLK